MSTSEQRLSALEARMSALEARLTSAETGRTAASEMPDVDIDSEHGNPVIRKDPPRWKGRSFVGQPYSMCSPEYLRELSGFLVWKAGKNREDGKEKYAKYDMLDAARAIAHAKRIERRGHAAPGAGDDEELPF